MKEALHRPQTVGNKLASVAKVAYVYHLCTLQYGSYSYLLQVALNHGVLL